MSERERTDGDKNFDSWRRSALALGPEVGTFHGVTGPHLWEIRAVRDVVIIALVIGFLWVLTEAAWATVSVLLGFGLAYLADPVLRVAQERLGVPRKVSIVLALLVIAGVIVGFWVLVGPVVIHEGGEFLDRLPRYIKILRDQYGIAVPGVADAIADAKRDPQRLAEYLRPALSWIGGVVGLTTSTLIAVVLTLAVFTVTAWQYERLPGLKQYLPQSRRERWFGLFKKIERVFAGFVRGQLVVAGFTTIVFGTGFLLVGVPYWFIAAAIGGLFSIIPYGQASGWVVAVLLSLLEAEAESGSVDWLGVLLGPTVVYAVMQSLETFVITPLVQGSSTKLHPVAVLAAVVGGGSLGGIVGVFLAIPMVASAWIFAQDVLHPKLKQWAADN